MALSETQSRCVGRTDLSPEGPVCPKRETCQRYTDLRDRGGDYAWPKHISVFTHVCSDPELSQFVPVEVVGHERNSAAAPDMGESLGLGLQFHPVVLPGDVVSSSAFGGAAVESAQ